MHAYLSEMSSCWVHSLFALSLHSIVLSNHISCIKNIVLFIKTCCFSLSENILNILALSMNTVIELPINKVSQITVT